jgi:hypothetical protein
MRYFFRCAAPAARATERAARARAHSHACMPPARRGQWATASRSRPPRQLPGALAACHGSRSTIDTPPRATIAASTCGRARGRAGNAAAYADGDAEPIRAGTCACVHANVGMENSRRTRRCMRRAASRASRGRRSRWAARGGGAAAAAARAPARLAATPHGAVRSLRSCDTCHGSLWGPRRLQYAGTRPQRARRPLPRRPRRRSAGSSRLRRTWVAPRPSLRARRRPPRPARPEGVAGPVCRGGFTCCMGCQCAAGFPPARWSPPTDRDSIAHSSHSGALPLRPARTRPWAPIARLLCVARARPRWRVAPGAIRLRSSSRRPAELGHRPRPSAVQLRLRHPGPAVRWVRQEPTEA